MQPPPPIWKVRRRLEMRSHPAVLGLPSSVNRRNVNITTHGGWEDGFYIQDQWKASNKLQINVGFRYDITLWPIYGSHDSGQQLCGGYRLRHGPIHPGCCSRRMLYRRISVHTDDWTAHYRLTSS